MTRSSLLIGVVTAAALLVVAGCFSILYGQSGETIPAALCAEGQIETLQWGDPSGDLQSCQQNCRSSYRVDPYTLHWSGGGSYTPGYYLYARCIESCNKRFWNEFDRRMDRLRNE
jgi:hypothetical protein